jgi:hypothetical protein
MIFWILNRLGTASDAGKPESTNYCQHTNRTQRQIQHDCSIETAYQTRQAARKSRLPCLALLAILAEKL